LYEYYNVNLLEAVIASVVHFFIPKDKKL